MHPRVWVACSECVACVASVWRVRMVTPFPLPHNIERSPQMRGNVNRYLKMLGSTTQGHAAQSQNGRPKITHEFLEIAFSGSHFYWVTFSTTRAIENSHTRGRTTQCVLVMMYARIILNPMAPFGVCFHLLIYPNNLLANIILNPGQTFSTVLQILSHHELFWSTARQWQFCGPNPKFWREIS